VDDEDFGEAEGGLRLEGARLTPGGRPGIMEVEVPAAGAEEAGAGAVAAEGCAGGGCFFGGVLDGIGICAWATMARRQQMTARRLIAGSGR